MITIKDKQKTLFQRQDKLRSNPTNSELTFKNRLEQFGINFIFQKCFIAKDYYCIVDFYLPKPHKVCFEIDGEYHDSPEQKSKDYYRTKYLTEVRGFTVIRIKNSDVNDYDLSSLIKKSDHNQVNRTP